jgi:hypothetical protein
MKIDGLIVLSYQSHRDCSSFGCFRVQSSPRALEKSLASGYILSSPKATSFAGPAESGEKNEHTEIHECCGFLLCRTFRHLGVFRERLGKWASRRRLST